MDRGWFNGTWSDSQEGEQQTACFLKFEMTNKKCSCKMFVIVHALRLTSLTSQTYMLNAHTGTAYNSLCLGFPISDSTVFSIHSCNKFWNSLPGDLKSLNIFILNLKHFLRVNQSNTNCISSVFIILVRHPRIRYYRIVCLQKVASWAEFMFGRLP